MGFTPKLIYCKSVDPKSHYCVIKCHFWVLSGIIQNVVIR